MKKVNYRLKKVSLKRKNKNRHLKTREKKGGGIEKNKF